MVLDIGTWAISAEVRILVIAASLPRRPSSLRFRLRPALRDFAETRARRLAFAIIWFYRRDQGNKDWKSSSLPSFASVFPPKKNKTAFRLRAASLGQVALKKIGCPVWA